MKRVICFIAAVLLLSGSFPSILANIPGGGSGTGANVTITDNGTTVTLNNGIVSIVVTKSSANIYTINYTFNNNGSSQTLNLLAGGSGGSGGYLYWFQNGGTFITGPFTESVVSNTPDYGEISLFAASATNGTVDIHFSMRRGSPGFYTTAIVNHRSTDGNMHIELRPNIYGGSIFNWMTVDAARNRLMEVSGGSSIGVQGAPKECYLWTNGIYAGQYEDKYKYSATYGKQRAWGWSSVGTGGKNIGLWDISASMEFYPGGPMMRELMEHIGTTMLNVFTGNYYGMSTDGGLSSGETWSHVYGPYLYYCNAVTNTLTGTNAPAQALYSDALAQAAAEATAWPYSWFANTNYVPATNRGTVTGKMVINDSGNPTASVNGLWVGLVQQPSTAWDTVYDFQQWMKPYQFWTQTDTNGNFSIPDVIAGTNYTLYAFGPGAAGTFMSQNQTGGTPPLLYNLPASPFSVTVSANGTNSLGTVTWTPTRVGATVFEIGYPDRTAAKFRHGDDYWVGDIGPSSASPSPVWSKWLEYPFDFPNGVSYTVGQSRWTTDWNFCQPVVTDSQGNYNSSSSSITFNLPSAPANGATASLYLGLCSDYYAAIIVSVNGVNAANLSGLSASPNGSVPSTGYYSAYGGSDTTIREGNNGAFTDERLTFSASALHAGQNTITITFRQIAASYFANHFMYDYVRLELTGYVPPAPSSVVAYPGNNCNLVCWPVMPGATSYNILRSTTSGSGYVSITNGVTGPVCGSGTNNATFIDTTAVNGTTYYYVVQSVNPNGASANSPQSSGVAPAVSLATTAPMAPTGLAVSSRGHQSVTLTWNAAAGANYYSVFRSTLMNNGGGASNVLSTIILNNSTTGTNYTDTTPTDGCIYRYFVTAASAGGTSTNSNAAVGIALPTSPASAPFSLTASFVYGTSTNITLNWTAVSGAVGYVISRATSATGPYTYLQTVTETTYTDYNLNPSIIYYYRVSAMNAAGVSANNTDSVNSQMAYPPSLTAVATNAQVLLSWSAVTNATSYTVKRGTSAGGETVTVVSGYTFTTYTNTGLANGTTYYYVVTATGTGGTSGNSPEVAATPQVAGNGIWISALDGIWSATTNWNSGSIASGSGNIADFSTLSLQTNVTVTLDSARTISGLKFGDTSGNYNWTLAGTNTLTLGSAPAVNVVNDTATIAAPIAGTAGLAKYGAGALTLAASNTVTGGATVNAGALTLDFTSASAPGTNLIPAANALTLAGGALQITGSTNSPSSQSVASTTLNAGASVVSGRVSGANLPTVNLAAISATAGGVIEFVGPATIGAGSTTIASNAVITTTASGNGAFVGGNGSAFFDANFATVGQYDFAATVGSVSPYTVVGGSQIAGFYTSASGSTGVTGGNLDVVGNISGWTAQPYLTSIRCNASLGANQTITAANLGSTLTLADVLVTPNVGNYNVTFNSGSIRPAGGSTTYTGPLVVWQNNTGGELIFNTTLGNSKVGAATYVQAGPGTVFIAGTGSGYTGQSYLNGGVTLIAANGSIGAAATGAAVNLNGGTLVANGTFALDNAGANLRPINLLANGGGLAATAGNTLTVDGVVGSAASAGPLTIGFGTLPGTGSGTANATVYGTGTVVLTNANYYTGGTVLQAGTLDINGLYALGGANYGGITFNGGTLQYAANFPGNNGSADLTSTGTAGVTLASGGGTVDLNGNTVTYAGAIGNGGSGSLVVKSSLAGGVLNLTGANNYYGATTVTNATLNANNASGSATGFGNVLVQNKGTLGGPGGVAGSVSVATGGLLAPGGFNAFDIGGNLTLANGSTTTVAVQHAPLSNAVVNVTGTLTEGGTLVVTNLGAIALTNGDSFQLFNAANFSGNFSSLTLPALATNLVWNTNTLATEGLVSVVTLGSPMISGLGIVGNDLSISATGGVDSWPCVVLSATNLIAPVWIPVMTNQFDASGNFSVTLTNAVNVNQPATFYRLQLQ